MSKHLLISGFEITVEAWVGDTEDGTATRIALQPFKVRPRDLGKWVVGEWPQQYQALKEQVALIELQEVEAQLVAELKRAAAEAEEAEKQRAASSGRKKPAKVTKATKKAPAAKGDADEEAALRARTYQDGGQATT